MKSGGGKGFADVWKKGSFGWEYKGNHADLTEAYQQLLRYHEHLENPPLLVVSDMQRFEIHTRFTNSVPTTYTITIDQIENPTFLNRLRAVSDDPAAPDPKLHPAELTKEAAAGFARLADTLRAKGHAPRPVAHFLTQSLFCFFAEDRGQAAPLKKGAIRESSSVNWFAIRYRFLGGILFAPILQMQSISGGEIQSAASIGGRVLCVSPTRWHLTGLF